MKFLIIILTLTISCQLLADTFYIGTFSSPENTSNTNDALKVLLNSALKENGHQVTTNKSTARKILSGEIIKTGNTYMLIINQQTSFGIRKTEKVKFYTLDNLDIAINKGVEAVLTNPSNNKVELISQKGPSPNNEIKSANVTSEKNPQENYWFNSNGKGKVLHNFSFGPTGLGKMNNNTLGYYLHYALLKEVGRNALIRGMLEGTFSTKNDRTAHYLNGNLGALFYTSKGENSPYFGLDMGLGRADHSAVKDVFGFTGGLSAGMMLFRTSNTHLGIEGRYSILFKDNGNGLPSMYGIHLGLYF